MQIYPDRDLKLDTTLAAGSWKGGLQEQVTPQHLIPASCIQQESGVFFKYLVCYLFSIELQSEMQTHCIVFLTEHLLIFQLFSLSEKSIIRSEGKWPARTLLQFVLTGQNFGTGSLTMLGWKIR